MDTLYRQWLTLRMIPHRGRIGTNEIRNRLLSEYGIETTLRTIQRDLISLSRNHSLVSDEEHHAGWCWSKDAAAFDIPNMDPVTALTFKLAETYLSRMMPHGVLTALDPYFKTAGTRLQQTKTSSLSSWPDKVRVVSRNLATISPIISEQISDEVYRALLEERRFRARYQTVGEKTKEHEVNPLGMVFVEGLTYLVVTLNSHIEPVLILLHRLLSVTLLETAVTVPDGFNLDIYVAKEFSFPLIVTGT